MSHRTSATQGEGASGLSMMDEATLVARAQDGDLQAFEELVVRYENRLYRYAYGMLGNRSDAEDVLQESLIRMWRALPSLTTAEAFGAWVYRITTHRCRDVLARRSARRTDPVDPHELPDESSVHATLAPPDPARSAETRHQLDSLAELVGKLPPDDRACWLLREVHQRSYRSIALALSVPESTVRGRLARARKELAKGMSSWR